MRLLTYGRGTAAGSLVPKPKTHGPPVISGAGEGGAPGISRRVSIISHRPSENGLRQRDVPGCTLVSVMSRIRANFSRGCAHLPDGEGRRGTHILRWTPQRITFSIPRLASRFEVSWPSSVISVGACDLDRGDLPGPRIADGAFLRGSHSPCQSRRSAGPSPRFASGQYQAVPQRRSDVTSGIVGRGVRGRQACAQVPLRGVLVEGGYGAGRVDTIYTPRLRAAFRVSLSRSGHLRHAPGPRTCTRCWSHMSCRR